MMLQSSLVYVIILWLLVEVNCQIARHDHTASLISNKLYILGGSSNINNDDIGKEFFYLDFSFPLNTQQLSWQDISSRNDVPSHEGAASVGVNNTLFLYGGRSINNESMELVYKFNPQINSWNVPKIVGDVTTRKAGLMGIVDTGKMYLWGGLMDKNCVNDMLILDTINLNWKMGSLDGAPSPRMNYGATLLPNNKIIYMGGNKDDVDMSLNDVYIYDTVDNIWNKTITSGKIPSNRKGFTAVLGLDNQRVIIFGGFTIDSTDALYVLNLSNFEWYIPNISGKIPESRYDHKANIIGKYMVISFGVINLQKSDSHILLLDISDNEKYEWTTIFDSPVYTPPPPLPKTSPSGKPSKITTATIGAIVGGSAGFILVGLISVVVHKRRRNDNHKLTKQPGRETIQTAPHDLESEIQELRHLVGNEIQELKQQVNRMNQQMAHGNYEQAAE